MPRPFAGRPGRAVLCTAERDVLGGHFPRGGGVRHAPVHPIGRTFFLTRRHRVFSAVLGIPAAVFFAAMAGFTPSVSRAAVMLSLSLFGASHPPGIRFAVCPGLCRAAAFAGQSHDCRLGRLSAFRWSSGGNSVLQRPSVRLDDEKGEEKWEKPQDKK